MVIDISLHARRRDPSHGALVSSLTAAALAGAFGVGALQAQATGRDSVALASTPPTIEAAARRGPIHIDGSVTEEAWRLARPATRFIQREPVEGAAAEETTLVYVLFDDHALYVGVVMHESHPRAMGTQLVRRDEWGAYDYFELSIDPNSDRRTGYLFRVSAAGVQRDAYLYDDVREDDAWNAVWESAVRRDDRGWSAELRIPLSQIVFEPAAEPQSWGVNFTRRRLAGNEETYFALESQIAHGRVSVFGRLTGLLLLHAPRRIEIQPYVVGVARKAPAEPGDPFFDGSDFQNQVGGDLRFGVGQYALDLTVNPDFGQVEADPAVVNLTAFETFFPEKRPFFVEGAQLFDFPDVSLLHSRRIGREPHGSAPDDAEYSDAPEQTTILGAAKFTGRTPAGLTLGALAALTREETGRAYIGEADTVLRFVAEPRTLHGAVRLRQDLRDGATQVGVIATTLYRDLPHDGSLDFLTTTAVSGGIDFEHNWGGLRSRDWALWGFFATSYVHGSPRALLDVQQASNHYFQRPDATRFALDSSRTALGGRNWRLQFERRSARHWTGAVWVAEVSSGFEVNDLGFWTQGERFDAGARIGYQQIRPGPLFRSYRLRAFTFHNWTHEALDDVTSWRSWRQAHKRGRFEVNADLEFLNYWGLDLEAAFKPTMTSDVATRGGPLITDPAELSFQVRGNTDRRRTLVLEPSFEYMERLEGGYAWETELEIRLRPIPSIEVELSPRFASELDPAQYVATTDDLGYGPTFGPRYLFGDLDRRSFTFETRLNAVFSPKLSLQLYAQPLISSGNYLAYKTLERPQTFDFDVLEGGTVAIGPAGAPTCEGGRICLRDGERYVDFDGDGITDFSFPDENFTVRSFRMTAVLRWEYRPGSAVFLVWQQSRRGEDQSGSFDFGRDFGDLWSAEATNRFLVKVTYWLGL